MAERRTVAEVQGSEQEWKVSDYDWDPTAVQARKRRAVTKGGEAEEGGTAVAAQGPAGLSLDEQLGLNIGLLQPQLWPTPILNQLPVLNIDKDDDEPATVCQVEGCNVSLLGLKRYYVINRVCEAHLRSPAIIVNGTLSRFCQQCNKFQFIGKFSGSKRSCTYKLERHNARHRAKMQQKRQQQQLQQQQGGAGTGEDAPAADDGGSAGEAPPSPARKRRPAAAAKKDAGAAAAGAAATTGTRRSREDAASAQDDAMHAASEAQVRSQVVPQPQKAAAGGPGAQHEQSSGGEAMDGIMPDMGRVGSGTGSAGCAASSFNRAVAVANGAPQVPATGGRAPGPAAGRSRTGAEMMKLEGGGTAGQAAVGAAPNGHSPYGTYDAHGAPEWLGLQAPPPGGQQPRYPDVQVGAPARVTPGGGSTGVPTPPAGPAPWDVPTAGANGHSAYPYLRNSDASANAGGWQPLAPANQRPDREQAAAYPQRPNDAATPYSRQLYPAAPYDVACALGATHPWIPPPPPPPPVLTHGSMAPAVIKRESSGSPPATGAGFAVPGNGLLVDSAGRAPHDGSMQPYPGAQNQMEGSSSRSNSIKALADVGSGGAFEAAGGSTAAVAAAPPAHASGSPAGLLLPGAASPGPASSDDGVSAAHGAAVSTGSGRGSFGATAARGASAGTASAAMAGTPEGAPGPVAGHVAARISSIMQELGPLIDQIKRQVGQAPGSAGAAAVAALTSAAEGIATSKPGGANPGSGSGTQTPAAVAAATAAAAAPGGAGSEQLPVPLIDAAVEMLRRAAELANVLKPQGDGASDVAAAPTSVQPPPTHVKAQPQASAGSAGRPGGVGTPAASEGRAQDGSAGPLAAAALSGGAAGDSSFDAAAAMRADGGAGAPAEHDKSGSSGGMVAWPAPGTTASGGAGGGSALAAQQQQQQRSAPGPSAVPPSWGNAPPPSWPAHLNDVGYPRAVSPVRRLPYGHPAYASAAAGGSAVPYQDGSGLPSSPYQAGGPSPYNARVHRYPGRHAYSSYPPYAPYPTYDSHSAGPYGAYPSYHPHVQHPVYGAQAGSGAGAPALPAASPRPATLSGGSGPAIVNGPASNGPAQQARPASNGSYPAPYNGSGSAFVQRGVNNTLYAAGSPAVNELPYQGGQPALRPMHSNTQSDTNSAPAQPQLAMPSQHGCAARGGDGNAAEMFAADQHLAALGNCAGGAAGMPSGGGGGAGVSGGGGVEASGGSNNALDADLFSMLFDLGQEPDPFPGTGSGHIAGGAAQARDLAAFNNQQQRDDNLMYGLAGAAHRAIAADQRAMSAVPYGGAVPPPTGAWQAGQSLPSAGPSSVQAGYAATGSGSGRDGMYQHPLQSTHGSVPPAQMLADPYYPYGSTQPSQRAAPAGQYGWEHGMASVPTYQQQQQLALGGAGYPGGMGAHDDVDYAELERVSLKVMNLLPHELPPNMRSNLRRWLKEGSAELQQATLRPGCVQLVVDCTLRRAPIAAFGSPSSPSFGSEQLAAALIPAHDADQVAADVFRMLGQRLRDTFVQVGRQVLQIRMGEDPVVLGWEEAAEDGGLPGAKMPVVEGVSAPAVCAGSEATLELRGLNLQQQQRTRPYARLRGHDLAATELEGSSSSRSSGVLGVRVSLPGRAVGLMVVEVGVGHLLGGWWPVLVLPPGQGAAVEELRRVQEQQQRQGDATGARRLVMDFSRVLETVQATLEAQAAAQAAAAAAANRYLLASPVDADADSPVAANVESAAAAAAASRSSSPDSMYGTSTSGGASHAGFTFTSGVDSTALGSTHANTLSTGLATSSTTGVARNAAVPAVAVAASSSAAAAIPALGGGDGAAGAAAGPGAAASAPGAVPAVPPPPMPSATALRQAIMRAGRLVRFAVTRGLPHCTALLLASAERLASALAATNPMPPTATNSRSPSPHHHQQHQHQGAEGAAHEEQQQELVIALLSAAGLSPQALLPLAVVSGCTELVEVLAAFSERVVGAPLRADLPQGPYGMSLLHVAATLPDGGAMACALLRAVPWAAWGWVCVGWMPPQLLRGVTSPAVPTLEVQEQAEDVTEDDDEEEGGVEDEGEEDEGDGELAPLQERVWLTPGALAAKLGRQEAPLRAALSVLRGEGRREGQVPVRSGGGVGQVDGGRSEVVGALAEAVRVCCTVSSTMMQLLCDELARQPL